MKPSDLSKTYAVRPLTIEDVDAIYALELGNPMFFEYCPPALTRRSILEDISALPPCMAYDAKYYVGFFQGQTLVAVLDLILHYPRQNVAFIGLFMVDASRQGRGVGSAILAEIAACLRGAGFDRIRLCFAKGNPQSEGFWQKNGFARTGEEFDRGDYTAVMMEKSL